jgi:hypothetical protein
LVTTKNFYAHLRAAGDFDSLSDGAGFVPVPDDWTVLISDVMDSTGAIERGEYKSVNMVGAASIVAVLNACQGLDVPFMFGGDGGVVVVPPEDLKAAKTRLGALQDKCPAMFGLTLRAAAIPVAELRTAGRDLQVCKFGLMGENHLAMFAGGGLELADKWLKADDDDAHHLKPEDAGRSLDLEGLSCRWQPLKSLNGVMLTVIMQTSGKGTNSQLSQTMAGILGKPISKFAPVQNSNLKLSGVFSKSFAMERAALKSTRGNYLAYAWTIVTGLAQRLADKFNKTMGDYDPLKYREEMQANTDYRKFDGALRMVIDVTETQASALEDMLEQGFRAGELVYGTWRSDAALMTCLLFDMVQSQHVHFIDGSDGGYTRAAKAMKTRIKETATRTKLH